MNTGEIVNHNDIHKYVCEIFNNPNFLRLKDAFIAHSPGGEGKNGAPTEEVSVSVAHGKNLGTRFVFNEIERIAKIPPQKSRAQTKQSGPDPDLAT